VTGGAESVALHGKRYKSPAAGSAARLIVAEAGEDGVAAGRAEEAALASRLSTRPNRQSSVCSKHSSSVPWNWATWL
jgi:hypothetical protein